MWSTLLALLLLCFSGVLYWLAPIFPQNPMPADLVLPLVWCSAYTLVASTVLGLLPRFLKERGRWLWVPAVPAFLFASYTFAKERLPQKPATLGKTTPAMCNLQFLGMDGLDHAQLKAMGSELPNFQRLYAEAAWAPLKTVSRHSPEIWTSVVTGMKPKDHGVSGYTTSWLTGTALELPDDSRDWLGQLVYRNTKLRTRGAVGSNARRVRALWELAGDYQRNSVFVNWWASYPAEPVSGIIISNHAIPWYGFTPELLDHAEPMATWPATEAASVRAVADQVVAELGAGKLRRDVQTEEGSRYFLVRDQISWATGRRLWREKKPDLLAVYVQGADTASHAWTFTVFGKEDPDQQKRVLGEAEAEVLFERLVRSAYRVMDQRLGEAMAEGSCIVLISDHGWRYDGSMHDTKPDGVFFAWGPPFATGEIPRASILDMMPTLLHTMGMPIAKPLPGKVIKAAFKPEYQTLAKEVSSFGPRGDRVAVHPASDDAEHIEALRALGYVE